MTSTALKSGPNPGLWYSEHVQGVDLARIQSKDGCSCEYVSPDDSGNLGESLARVAIKYGSKINITKVRNAS